VGGLARFPFPPPARYREVASSPLSTELNSLTFNEAQTRALHIDPQLRAADWKLNDRTQVRLEVSVDGYDAEP
jgi:hypothetical protein